MEQSAGVTQASPGQVSAVSALWSVLLEPKKTFEGLREKSPWVLPFVLGIVLVFLFTYFTWPYIMDGQIKNIRMNENIPDAQKETIVAQMETTRNDAPLWQVGLAPVFAGIATLIGAGIWLMVGNVMLGGNATFKQIWSMFNYAGMVSLVGVLIKWVMISMKQSVEVYTSLAVLATDLKTSSYAFLALNGVDIFSIWLFAVIGIGLAVVCRVAVKKAMVASFVVWAVWVFGIQAGLGALTSGMFGM